MDILIHVPLADKFVRPLDDTELALLGVGCPSELLGHAKAMSLLLSKRMVARYGVAAPLCRVAEAIAEAIDDPTAVIADGATDDPLGDMEPQIRDFAALMAGRAGGGLCLSL